MNLPTTKKTKQNVPFKTTRDAIQAIQNTTLTESTTTLVTNSNEFQALVRTLTNMPRPFGIVLVKPRE